MSSSGHSESVGTCPLCGNEIEDAEPVESSPFGTGDAHAECVAEWEERDR